VGVVCWHEERPEVIAELLALGVDGICTDEPALLTRLATRRPAARRDDG
jgi:glycerophosphoryl diester phosphodiesterase